VKVPKKAKRVWTNPEPNPSAFSNRRKSNNFQGKSEHEGEKGVIRRAHK